MRITTDQKIAGYSAMRIRQLMRQTVDGSMTLRHVRRVLGCSNSVATRVLKRLQKDGFVESARGHLEVSVKGNALAMATAASPLRRATAARLIAGLLERAKAVNADDNWAYLVGRVVVFGSYVRGVERPNDVDVACELRPRWTPDRQLAQEQVRRELRAGQFRNTTQWALWPKLEVFRFLKARTRGLSVHELEDWILKTENHQVLFEEKPRRGGNGLVGS
jgi:DNA-binding MarR family transcriptional regulator